MSFRDFKKELNRKKEQESTMRELNSAISTLTNKRDKYAEEAKKAFVKYGSESFMCCAISGVILGGVGEAVAEVKALDEYEKPFGGEGLSDEVLGIPAEIPIE